MASRLHPGPRFLESANQHLPPRVPTANSGSRDQQLVGLDSVLMDLTSPLPIFPFPGDNVPVP